MVVVRRKEAHHRHRCLFSPAAASLLRCFALANAVGDHPKWGLDDEVRHKKALQQQDRQRPFDEEEDARAIDALTKRAASSAGSHGWPVRSSSTQFEGLRGLTPTIGAAGPKGRRKGRGWPFQAS